MNSHFKKLVKLYQSFTYEFDTYTVFEDSLYFMGAAISNSADLTNFKVREDEYMRRMKKYSSEQAKIFAEIFATLVLALEDSPNDYLGQLFMELNISNKWKGQFFTPYKVALAMAQITLNDAQQQIDEKGYITIADSTCGGGVTLIAAFVALKEQKINPQRYAKFYGQDIDIRSVLMTYIQCSLLGMSIQVIHGDTLAQTVLDVWRSPFLVLNIFNITNKKLPEDEKLKGVGNLTAKIIEKEDPAVFIESANGQFALF